MKKGLGKGMMALVDENEFDVGEGGISSTLVNVNKVIPNRYQPRKQFDDASLKELANSIKEKGVISPILVSELGDGRYELVAGERRLRASKLAGIMDIPVIVRDFTEEDRMEIALVENIQREDLNALEIASAYKEIMEKLNLSQEDLSKKIGKSRSAIANTLRLLKLPEYVRDKLSSGEISEGHARAIMTLENFDTLIDLTNKIIQDGLSVRETEFLAKEWKKKTNNSKKEKKKKTSKVSDLEEKFIKKLQAKVEITGSRKKGKVQIYYYSEAELESLYKRLPEE